MSGQVRSVGHQPGSLRAYATHRGCVLAAVQRGIARGLLVASVTRDERGRPKITDWAAADAEWAANMTRADPRQEELVAQPRRGDVSRTLGAELASHQPEGEERLVLSIEAAREKRWKAKLAALEYRERAGELVEAKAMVAKIAGAFSNVRARLLAVPSRMRQQDPSLTLSQIALIDSLIREALEELANGFEAEANVQAVPDAE